MFTCVVCGSHVDRRAHLYRTVALCDWRCRQKFDRDPLLYLPLELELIEY